MKCLAADDEPLALSIIRNFCSKIPFTELVATASSGIEVAALLRERDIDLLLLDINMPHISGVELARSLEAPPMIVFTTAYPNYALEGFEVNAVDYLIKPFSFERFFRAVSKAYELHSLRQRGGEAASPERERKEDGFVMVKVDTGIVRVPFREIWFVEGLKDYVRIHTAHGRYVTKSTMKNIEERLCSGFMRIHRSTIVNLSEIESFGNNQVVIRGTSLPVGQQYREPFLAYLDRNRL